MTELTKQQSTYERFKARYNLSHGDQISVPEFMRFLELEPLNNDAIQGKDINEIKLLVQNEALTLLSASHLIRESLELEGMTLVREGDCFKIPLKSYNGVIVERLRNKAQKALTRATSLQSIIAADADSVGDSSASAILQFMKDDLEKLKKKNRAYKKSSTAQVMQAL